MEFYQLDEYSVIYTVSLSGEMFEQLCCTVVNLFPKPIDFNSSGQLESAFEHWSLSMLYAHSLFLEIDMLSLELR